MQQRSRTRQSMSNELSLLAHLSVRQKLKIKPCQFSSVPFSYVALNAPWENLKDAIEKFFVYVIAEFCQMTTSSSVEKCASSVTQAVTL